MATVFTFVVEAEYAAADVNVIDRLSGSYTNIGDRFPDGAPVDDYVLTLAIVPVQFQPGQACRVTLSARRNGQPIASQVISVSTTDAGKGLVPASVTTSTNGDAVFELIGLALGTATINASMVIDGDTYSATGVGITVSEQAPPVDWDATGYGRVEVDIETMLSTALNPVIERLSHAEQQRKYPDDTGLRMLTYFETAEIVFVPKALQ